MNKIWLVIQREFMTRVRKKSFLVMTFLGPLLLVGMYGLAIFIIIKGDDLDDAKKVVVVNENTIVNNSFDGRNNVVFTYESKEVDSVKKTFLEKGYDYLLYIPEFSIDDPEGIKLYSESQASITTRELISSEIRKQLEEIRLVEQGISKETLAKLKPKVSITTLKITKEGEQASSTDLATIIGIIASIAIYFTIFLYGVQVMRGVLEEKTSRIVEVIVSSVKPFQLMMGKILGVAAVGLLQYFLWIVLTLVLATSVSAFVGGTTSIDASDIAQIQSSPLAQTQSSGVFEQLSKNEEFSSIFAAFDSINITQLLISFMVYFIGGYLIYSALFAAIAAAVDSESDMQQFMLPVTLPLIFSIIIGNALVVNSPNGTLAFWFSMIPLTSPIVMMLRIPFGVPLWELLLSMTLLVAGFIFIVWVASKIYRTGILMYGKKITYKELWKWLRY
ncbi:MAG: ABC-2 type transport system permease protein [Sphingobacteriales bacterium]|jgi:ABC-2 type transport system permease protein